MNLAGIPLAGPAAACSVLPGCSLPRQGAGTARYVRTGPLLARGPVRCVSGILKGVSRGLTCTFPQCTRCSAGTWGVGKLGNDEECIACGVGYYSTTLGGTSAGVCQACSGGKFFNDTRGTQVRLFFSRVLFAPHPVLLCHPFHSVVVLNDPTVLRHVIRDFDDPEPRELAPCGLHAHTLDDLDQNRIVSLDIRDDVPILGFRDILCSLLVEGLYLVREVETPIAPIDYDFSGHEFRRM